jgi:hypothetical protein
VRGNGTKPIRTATKASCKNNLKVQLFCQVKFRAKKNLLAIWLFALFLSAFSIALFAETPRNSVETVYCPLTKKLQPVKAQKKEDWQNPLENICADEKEKKSFADELFRQNLLKTASLDEKQFENLVFDFFQKGKAAFAGLPQFPDSPQKNSVKTFSAVIGFGKTDETQFVWKSNTDDFSFASNPRPPNCVSANLFKAQTSRKLEKISHRIAPRAPPFSL